MTNRTISWMLVVLCASTFLSASEQSAAGPPVIAAAIDGEKVRFTAPGTTAQIRVQILAFNGNTIFDSAWKDGNFLDWATAPLGDGSYRCVVMVKTLDGQVSDKEVALIAAAGKVSIDGTKDTSAITLLAHDGVNGAIVSTTGDLSFRFGDFIAGKDAERMRLTAEGDLRVDGVIRAGKGIMFSDGTILTTAAGLAAASGSAGQQHSNTPVGRPVILRGALPAAGNSNTNSLNPRPASAPPDYQFKMDNTGVHIGTTSVFGLTVAGDVSLSSNLVLPLTTSATAGVITQGIDHDRFAHTFGLANTFLGINAGNFTMSGGYNASRFAPVNRKTLGGSTT